MKTQITSNYARVLYELKVPETDIHKSEAIFAEVGKLVTIFQNPVIPREKKEELVDKIFPESIRNFLKVTIKHKEIGSIQGIFAAYQDYCNQQKKIVSAILTYFTEPEPEQMEKMKDYICARYHADEVLMEEKHDESLLGGFVLRVGSDEYDYSTLGRLHRMKQKLSGGER